MNFDTAVIVRDNNTVLLKARALMGFILRTTNPKGTVFVIFVCSSFVPVYMMVIVIHYGFV